MIVDYFRGIVKRRLRLREADELGRDGATLVHELVEAVLSIGAWLTEDDWSRVHTLA